MGADLLTIIPTRNRPTVVPVLAAAFHDTCTTDWQLAFAVDENDPDLPLYASACRNEHRIELFINRGTKTMVGALNAAAAHYLNGWPYAIGFMGDDHRPRTLGWDRFYLDALRELGTGFVYGNDLLQGERIPTQVAMTANIPRALGHMAPTTLTHLFVDNYWRDLGKAADCIRYLPDVHVEHVHPYAGKVDMDDGYLRVNAPEMYQKDAGAYARYAATRMPDEIAKLKVLR